MTEHEAVQEAVMDEDIVERELDARREQMAQQLVTYLAWGTGLAALMSVVVWLFAPRYTQLLGLAVSVALLFGATWGHRLLRQQNRTRLGAHVVLLGLLLVVSTAFVFLPEIQSTLIVGLIVAVFMAYQLLGVRAGLRYALRSFLIVIVGMAV